MATNNPTNLNEYYQGLGQSLPSIQQRQGLATSAGITGYIGTAQQNATLLNYLQNQGASTNSANNMAGQSTTTLSTSNASNNASNIQNYQNNLQNSGITTINGIPTYANGTPVPQPTTQTLTANSQTGGYYGNLYVRPGDPIPLDANGKEVTLTPTSPQDDANKKMLEDMKANFDAQGVTQLQNIENTYNNLISQQELQNKGAEAGTTNALFMSGAMQHDVYSNDKITAQVNYGLQQIQNLNAQKQQAISEAKAAIQSGDFELAGKIQAQTDEIIKRQQDAMNKINDTLIEKNAKLNEDKMKATKDSAIASMYQNGITDPTMMLSELKKAGWDDISISDVKGVLDVVDKNLADFKKQQQDIVNAAQTAGDYATAEKVLQLDPASPTFTKDLAYLQGKMRAKAPAGAKLTEGERKTQNISGLQNLISSGQPLKDGTPVVDSSGFATPKAWKALIAQAPSEGITRLEFIKEFGNLLYMPNGKVDPSYGLTPAEQKILTGALPS